jgi:peptidyl-Lys metalloendopeptidase
MPPKKPFHRAAVAALALGASAAALAAHPLEVSLSTAQTVLQGDGAVAVDIHITNTGPKAVKVLKWQLPLGELQGPLFKVTREDGSAAPYLGPLIKRGAPQAGDYLRIAPGATLSYQVDLASRYALGNGRVSVAYLGAARQTGQADLVSAQALQLWTSGRSAPAEASAAPAAPEATVATISYQSCSDTQITQLSTAVADATVYAGKAKSYLKGLTSGSARYTTWFGTYSDANRRTVLSHFSNERKAFTSQPLVMNCACTGNYYAYVYPNDPYKIYLCKAFWTAPAKGTDSKAGTLVHEMSHFTVVGGTDDYAYGQAAAKALAISDPLKAIANADSHEYFAENTPAQP